MSIQETMKQVLSACTFEKSYGWHYFTCPYSNGRLNGCLEFTEAELKQADPKRIQAIMDRLHDLDSLANQKMKQKIANPDTRKLNLTDLSIYTNYACSLGYKIGKGPTGEQYVYVKFYPDFSMYDELIYETY